jgi:hypothetical protein
MVRTPTVWLAALALLAGCGDKPEEASATADCADLRMIYIDADGDGHGDPTTGESACGLREGWVEVGDDCDDSSAAVHPGAVETCSGVDDNCDGRVDVDAVDAVVGYLDADGDGHGDAATATARCALLADEVATAGDCDDGDAAVHPEAEDVCDEQDRDCDGEVDACPDASWTRAGADLTWTGAAPHDGTGAALAVVEDEAGDALLVGAPDHDQGDERGAGAVYLAAGGTEGALSDGAWVVGGEHGAHLGTAVVGVASEHGPVLAVSAPGASVEGLPRGGAVYLLSSGALGTGDSVEMVADATLQGPAAWTGAGTAVVSAGDSNNDGIEDLLVAAGAGDGAGERRGEVWLVQPPPGGLSGAWELDAFPRWEGRADHDGLGAHAGLAAGDLNGDGVTDIVLGAYGHDREAKGDERIGGVWVVEGREPEFPLDNALDDAEAFVEGVIGEDQTWFGAALLSPGDLDGDGYDELVVGGPWFDREEDGPEAGAVWVFSGSGDGVLAATATDAALTVLGEASWDWFGGRLAASPDLDGDGSPELLVSADAADPGGHHSAGAVYIVPSGLAGGTIEAGELDLIITGSATNDRLGASLAAGDLDADGLPDLLIGAPGVDDSGVVVGFLGVSTGE